MKAISLYKCKVVFLALFVFSLPFEYWDPFSIAYIFSITKVFGFLYAVFSLLTLSKRAYADVGGYRMPVIMALWVWLVIQSIFHSKLADTLGELNLSLLQCIFLFWLVSEDFKKNARLVKFVLLAFVLGAFAMSILAQLGIGYQINSELTENRLTFFGANPNTIGNLAVVAILIIVAMVVQKQRYFHNKTLLLLALLPSIFFSIGASGSRGAFVSLLVGLFVFVLFYKTTAVRKILFIMAGSVASYLFVRIILESDVMKNRLIMAIEENNSSGRGQIWKDALSIFYDHPLTGLGTSGYRNEMQMRFSYYLDTHNLFLFFLVSGGIVGLGLFLFFLASVFKSAYLALKYNSNSFPLAMFFVYLAIVSKSGGIMIDKSMWFLLAYVSSFPHSILVKYPPANGVQYLKRLMIKV